jgi:hypothetical protein
MERRHNEGSTYSGGSIVEGVEWRGRMKKQSGEKTDWRTYSGGKE